MTALWLAAVDAPVTSVTVFSDRARVVRTARVSLSGAQRVELPPLPTSVDPSSIRVEAQGAEVTRVEVRSLAPEDLPVAEVQRLVTELERSQARIDQLRAERDAHAAQLASLARVSPPEESPPTAKLDAAGWRAATDFLVDTTARTQAKVRELSHREQELVREQTQRLQEARRARDASLGRRLEVVALLSGQGSATLTLTYSTPSARWYPAYELRLAPESNQVEVAFAGRVSQETGEDWDEAVLALSTALPAGFSPVPRLATWKIGQRERFIPTPARLPDSWRPPPRPSPSPLLAPSEAKHLRARLTTFIGEPSPPPGAAPTVTMTESAQSSPGNAGTGTLVGTVVSMETKQPMPDVVVTVTSPALQADQVVVTDARGQYRIPQLPPGIYLLRFDKESFRSFSRPDVQVRRDRTIRVNVELLPEGDVTEQLVSAVPPTIDVGSTTTGVNVDQDFIKRIAVNRPGGKGGATRSFESLSELAPSAMNDAYGMNISGKTFPENGYVVDGLRASGGPSSYEPPPVEVPVGLAPPPSWRRPVLDPKLPVSLAGGEALSFSAQRRETVRSGGGEQRVPLFTEVWPVQVERELYPALTDKAFLVAQLHGPSQRTLPGGQAQLYVGADPSGQAQLQRVAPGEPFTLPLGIDPSVRPVRNVRLVSSDKGLFGSDELTEYVVTLEVANPYAFPLQVRLHDQWPLPSDEHVQIKLVSTEPYAEQDAQKGTLEWRLSIPPSRKQEVSFRYTLRRPKDRRLVQH